MRKSKMKINDFAQDYGIICNIECSCCQATERKYAFVATDENKRSIEKILKQNKPTLHSKYIKWSSPYFEF